MGKLQEVRGIVPWLQLALQELVQPFPAGIPEMALAACKELAALYDCLHRGEDRDSVGPCKAFTVRLLALHRTAPALFSFKPKVHWMIEMLEYSIPGAKPSSAWTYRDEELGAVSSTWCELPVAP